MQPEVYIYAHEYAGKSTNTIPYEACKLHSNDELENSTGLLGSIAMYCTDMITNRCMYKMYMHLVSLCMYIHVNWGTVLEMFEMCCGEEVNCTRQTRNRTTVEIVKYITFSG